jgi:hypothetical protein
MKRYFLLGLAGLEPDCTPPRAATPTGIEDWLILIKWTSLLSRRGRGNAGANMGSSGSSPVDAKAIGPHPYLKLGTETDQKLRLGVEEESASFFIHQDPVDETGDRSGE